MVRSPSVTSSHMRANSRPLAPRQMVPSVKLVATSRSVARTSLNGLLSVRSNGAKSVATSDHQIISCSLGFRAACNRVVIADRPTPFGVPRNARSSSRTWSNHASRSAPAKANGCWAIANIADAEKRLEIASTNASASVPGGVCSKGMPALSSTCMPHLRNCPATRTANSRSGVMRAVRLCATSSAPRIRTAIAFASCALSSASNHFACGKLLRNAGRPCHWTLCSGRQNISEIAAPFGSDWAVGRTSISLRSMPISSSRCFK